MPETQKSFGSMDSLNAPFLANKHINLPAKENFHSNEELLGSSRNKYLFQYCSVFLKSDVALSVGLQGYMLAMWVCWKEKGSNCGGKIALFWVVLRFDWHEFK